MESLVCYKLIFKMRHIIALFLVFLGIFPINAADFKGNWQYSLGDDPAKNLTKDKEGIVSAEIPFPGAALIYLERERTKMRPSRDDFTANVLSIDTKFESKQADEVKAVLFVKDKDGHWFQSQKIYHLTPGKWHTLSVKLPGSEKNLTPVGHMGSWNSLNAVTIHSVGINVFSKTKNQTKFFVKNLKRFGTRTTPKLTIFNWQKPETTGLYQTIEGSFELSREYLNPFDANEIKVDIEAHTPNGENIIWPAYFTQDYSRKRRFNKEILLPVGAPYWAYRLTPKMIGTYKLRINIEDKTPGSEVSVKSPWKNLKVTPSEKKGFIRVSKKDPRFFEFSTGELFYPIGFNLHTVRDLRSESVLKLGYQPDVGTYSYEEYLKGMKKNGVNSTEIWMAAWSFALEWTSARINYYGLGRYNLANAWRLDKILESAANNDVYIHLVLDNHGKLSSHVDPEWNNSPYNKHTAFAYADGATLNSAQDFYTDEKSWDYYKNRNRYIAGRWGANKTIYGVELWSEVNLNDAHDHVYRNNEIVEWHKKAARHFNALDQGNHPITTHTCGDYNNTVKFQKYYELDEIDYIVGDAYRKNTPFVTHMQNHINKLRHLKKPMLVTEYGGSPFGNSYQNLEADLHAGIWVSLFTEQAGTPYLWWHDFIHKLGHYDHFKGFSSFMKGIDPRGKGFIYTQTPVFQDKDQTDSTMECLLAGNSQEQYAWIFNKSQMVLYPENEKNVPESKGLYVMLKGLRKGSFLIGYYHTLTGKQLDSKLIYSDGVNPVKVSLPPFKIDVAVKILWQGETKTDTKVIKASASTHE